MITNDATILRLKHEVLYEVAKCAWEGTLEEKRDELPYQMIPGPQAQYRCCIYKERELIKQRVRLAEGKCPTGKDSRNVVQVINAACEECPIASYVVTDNCPSAWEKPASSPVISGLSAWAISMPILIRLSVRSAGSVPRPALITLSPIWSVPARRYARWMPSPMMNTASV